MAHTKNKGIVSSLISRKEGSDTEEPQPQDPPADSPHSPVSEEINESKDHDEKTDSEEGAKEVQPEPEIDTITKKTTEIITVQNDKYICDLTKNKITGDKTGTKEEIESIVIKKRETGRSLIKFKSQKDASDFLKLCMKLSIQLTEDSIVSERQRVEQVREAYGESPYPPQQAPGNPPSHAAAPPKAHKEVIQTEHGEVEFRQEYGQTSKPSNVDELFGDVEKSISPYNEAMTGGQTLTESLGLQGLTEDQLTEEQKAKIAAYKEAENLKTSSFFNTKTQPSPLKLERQKKLKEKKKQRP